MNGEENKDSQKTCFVVMGFGKKTDFETGRVLDLDKSYRNMIKPAVEAAGLKCIRADEIVHSGLIDAPMYEQLLNADVVVADLSTSNKNAFYELGVRHALRPFTTVVICEDGIKTFPFDISHVAVRQYHHLGEDIGFEEVMRFREQLTKAVKEIMSKDPRDKDSPVYTFLNGLTPPEIAAVQAKVQEAVAFSFRNIEDAQTKGIEEKSLPQDQTETHSILMQQVDQAQKDGDWLKAKTLLTVIRQMKLDELKKQQETATIKLTETQEDPYILQRLALITYKSKQPGEQEALIEARNLLNLLNPSISNDTETLGLWGAVHKRLYDITKERKYLDDAIRAYERGFFIRNDYYNGINFAFLLNVRASQEKNREESIADFVEARRVRKEVLEICKEWLVDNPMPNTTGIPANALSNYLKSWYWVKATIGEAYFGMGEDDKAQTELQEAYAKAPEGWMKGSTEEQLNKLKPMLANSPLKFIREEDAV
jgi:tetratricopeptide (TPR) repeat protein